MDKKIELRSNSMCLNSLNAKFLLAFSVIFGAVVIAHAVDSDPNVSAKKPGWTLTFADEFNGNELDTSRWQRRYTFGEIQINNELQAYVDDALTVNQSILTITGKKAPAQYGSLKLDYRSGVICSRFHQRYGYFETRCKLVGGRGFWPAFWLLGRQGIPGVNEIDILESLGHEATTVHMTVHWGKSYKEGHGKHGQAIVGADFTQGFHLFAVDWDAERIIWYIDGQEVFRHSGEGVPHVEMCIIANLAIGGNWPGPPDSTTTFPGEFEIDYIRAYQRAERP
jgi:beta-glucanase (GH16 family)